MNWDKLQKQSGFRAHHFNKKDDLSGIKTISYSTKTELDKLIQQKFGHLEKKHKPIRFHQRTNLKKYINRFNRKLAHLKPEHMEEKNLAPFVTPNLVPGIIHGPVIMPPASM